MRKRVRKSDGSSTVMENGRIVGNVGGSGNVPPTAAAAPPAASTPSSDGEAVEFDAMRERMLDRVVMHFFNSDNAVFFTDLWDGPPENFDGLCEEVNGEFAAYANSHGLDVQLEDWVGNGNGAAPDRYPHTVARLGNTIIDYTYRQIDPDGDIPHIVSVEEWRRDWDAAGQGPYRYEPT